MPVNFDNAATTFPKPESVITAARRAAERLGGNAGRGGHELAMRSSAAVYSAREYIAAFFGAQPENTVFTLNCTHALNMAIQGVMRDGGHLIISNLEHNSASRPAFTLAREKKISLSVAEVFPDAERTVESFRRLIRPDTKAIECTLASNVTGQLLPRREIAELCREKGICFIADGAQACGIVDISIGEGIDILCTAGHKGLYGLSGTGLLISSGKHPIYPIIQGGTGTASRSLEQPTLLPEALESGTLNIPGIMSLKAGCEFVKRIGTGTIFRHEDSLCSRFIDEIRNIPGIKIYRSEGVVYAPIVSFTVEDIPPEELAAELSSAGYCLRAGFQCAALAHSSLGTKNGTVRFSPSVFSRPQDAVSLAGAIKQIVKNKNK
jgi:cysteine desulfurase family protein